MNFLHKASKNMFPHVQHTCADVYIPAHPSRHLCAYTHTYIQTYILVGTRDTYIHTYIHPYIHPSIHPSSHECMHACRYAIHTNTRGTHVHTCMYACIHASMQTYMYRMHASCRQTCARTWLTYVHTYINHACMRTYTQTYTHTHNCRTLPATRHQTTIDKVKHMWWTYLDILVYHENMQTKPSPGPSSTGIDGAIGKGPYKSSSSFFDGSSDSHVPGGAGAADHRRLIPAAESARSKFVGN